MTLWIILGIVSWLGLGFFARGWRRAYEDQINCIDGKRTIMEEVIGLWFILGGLISFVITLSHIKITHYWGFKL